MPECETCGKSIDPAGPCVMCGSRYWCDGKCQAGKPKKAKKAKKAKASAKSTKKPSKVKPRKPAKKSKK